MYYRLLIIHKICNHIAPDQQQQNNQFQFPQLGVTVFVVGKASPLWHLYHSLFLIPMLNICNVLKKLCFTNQKRGLDFLSIFWLTHFVNNVTSNDRWEWCMEMDGIVWNLSFNLQSLSINILPHDWCCLECYTEFITTVYVDLLVMLNGSIKVK